MRVITKNELLKEKEYTNNFETIKMIDEDLSNLDLSNLNFYNSVFENVIFDNSNLSNTNFSKIYTRHSSYVNVDFSNSNLTQSDFRTCNLDEANACNTNFYFSILEDTSLNNVISDDKTKFFNYRFEKDKYYVGYKKCFNFKIVKLLILKDSLITNATNEACRTNKAKVLSITSFDEKHSFQQASALNDDSFIYKVGQIVQVDDFNEDRWQDSTTGIHFFMSREEAIGY